MTKKLPALVFSIAGTAVVLVNYVIVIKYAANFEKFQILGGRKTKKNRYDQNPSIYLWINNINIF